MAIAFTVALGACSKGTGPGGGVFGTGPVGSAGEDEGGESTDGGGGATDRPADDDDGPGDVPKPTTGGNPDPGGGVAGSCCQGNDTPGCDDAAIELCVCAQDSFCCDNVWDDLCASLVDDMGCGECDGPGVDEPDPTTDGGDDGGGDDGGDDGGGTTTGGGTTSGGTTTSGGGEDGGGGDGGGGRSSGHCCEANGSAGCDDAQVESCVCDSDAYCCTNEWDDICVGGVDEFGCGSCKDDGAGDDPPGPGNCCQAKATPGCSEPSVESCVCAQDPYCCSTAWDALCVGGVENFGCATC